MHAARLSRRSFVTRAAQMGLTIPVASALATAATRDGLAAPRLAFQDGGKTLVVAIPQATVQLDPAVAGSNGYGDILPLVDNITEGLTRFKPGTVEIEPALAESWEVSEDGLQYVFTIRPDVTFHDGTPLDAAAVETNFLRQFDEENPLFQETMVYAGIVFADVESVEATGDMELTVTMSRPSVLLPGNLAIFAAGIVSPTALEAEGADFGQSPVGTGPFRFDSWTKDVELVLVANDDYWGGDPRSTGLSGGRLPTTRSGSRSCRPVRSTSPTRSTSKTPPTSKATRIFNSSPGRSSMSSSWRSIKPSRHSTTPPCAWRCSTPSTRRASPRWSPPGTTPSARVRSRQP